MLTSSGLKKEVNKQAKSRAQAQKAANSRWDRDLRVMRAHGHRIATPDDEHCTPLPSPSPTSLEKNPLRPLKSTRRRKTVNTAGFTMFELRESLKLAEEELKKLTNHGKLYGWKGEKFDEQCALRAVRIKGLTHSIKTFCDKPSDNA